MKHIKSLAAVFIVALIACTACNTAKLAPGGAYSTTTTNLVGTNFVISTTSDLQLYQADAAFQLAYKSIDFVFTTEFNNRQYLWNISPSIKHALDKVRPSAVQFRDDYIAARQAYVANPTPTGLTGVQGILAKLQQLLFAATAALANNGAPGTNTVPVLGVSTNAVLTQ